MTDYSQLAGKKVHNGAMHIWPRDGHMAPGPRQRFVTALTSIRLTEKQARFVNSVRYQKRMTSSELVRQALDRLMEEDEWKEYVTDVGGQEAP